MTRPAGQLDRALQALTLDIHADSARRRHMLSDGYSGEFEQQFQVNISGTAGNVWGFVDQAFSFEFPFLWAPLQRRSDFKTPHFRCGIELTNPTPTLVLLHAHVIGWTQSPETWIIGANVRFAVCAPSVTTTAVAYNAIAHLAFEGYASLPQGVSDL
jgi:hypothetical protein